MSAHSDSENKVSFKDTLNLPQTDFPIRSNAAQEDPRIIMRWQQERLDYATFEHNKGKKKYILHDGPPYANGNIHIGHAFNKILKDIAAKSQRMMGRHVPVTPGWDCHGLPIEFKVSAEYPHLDRASLKKACRAYAAQWVAVQKEEFKRLGVLMNWEHPYLTMDYSYESDIVRAFGIFFEKGYIERKNKTVPWCFTCKTVLAAAEIEYEERKDPSIYVLFPLGPEAKRTINESLTHKEVSFVVWTTTPWTLPLNRAVLLKPHTQYAVLALDENTCVVVGETLAQGLCEKLGIEKRVVATFNSDIFSSLPVHAFHPFIEGLRVPVILDQSVLVEEGTACVHNAPGAGPEDYEIGVKNGLEIYSPVGPDGRYTAEIMPRELQGMLITDGQIWVLKALQEKRRLLYKTSIRHSYPHCWRCHQGLIFRATKQWFCDLSEHGLKEKALQATHTIATYPQNSINRLRAFIDGRLEWCLSRQRAWGVPIAAVICTACDKAFTSQEVIAKAAAHIEKTGVEGWDELPVTALVENLQCACGSTSFKKETDILDVWFDSGISHFAVLLRNKELAFPADLYLEGKDQHRGWFQSSLLSSMIIEETPAMRTIVTHGFTVDEKGRKMSKSLGNVVSPDQMIADLGTDGLRLWASSIDMAGEAVVSEKLTQNVKEVLRKIRNTARFLISNLYDFDYTKDAVSFDKMRLVDQYALRDLVLLNYKVIKSYNEYDFTAVYHALSSYCSSDLSALYLDIIKDRLYVEKADGYARRSAQTVCYYILDTLTRLMAPILSLTAEQITDYSQPNKKHSIHLQDFANLAQVAQFLHTKPDFNNSLIAEVVNAAPDFHAIVESVSDTVFLASKEDRWQVVLAVRAAILKAIEELRAQGIIKHSLEAQVTYAVDPQSPLKKVFDSLMQDLSHTDQTITTFLKELVIVSQVHEGKNNPHLAATTVPGLFLRVENARGVKCPRCWNWEESSQTEGLCARCQSIVGV